jgi:hypothetical protein
MIFERRGSYCKIDETLREAAILSQERCRKYVIAEGKGSILKEMLCN